MKFLLKHNVFRSINGRRRRGLAIAVKSEYLATCVSKQAQLPNVDLLVVKLSLPQGKVYIVNIYIPPQSSLESYESIFDQLEQLYPLPTV